MKLKNAPGRKNDRRKRALAREKNPNIQSLLKAKIMDDFTARSSRSKKDRRDRAKFAKIFQ